jgi:type I protein arginine methyltransferase
MSAALKEHIEYMSDPRRLELLRGAIDQIVQPGDLVADVGCGFGILGLMALQTGAAEVWGIDSTEAIEIARETMERAGLGERYHCLRESSFRAQLPSPVDLAVCDHIGFFGFDYGIVELLGDVRARLLKPGGRILPERIRPMIAGVASEACRSKAEAWARPPVPEEFGWLREYGINAKHQFVFEPGEVATGQVSLGDIDFYSENPEHFSSQVLLYANADCMLDGLGGWFEADLAPGITMTNSPLATDRIARGHVFLPFDEQIPMRTGECLEVSLSVRYEDTFMAWSARPQSGGRRQKQGTWRSLVLDSQNLGNRSERVPQLNAVGHASTIVRSYIDGQRSAKAIEEAVLLDHPQLFPSTGEIVRFVQGELGRFTQ